ncbi:MAG: FeoB-associated Cys-rich membrane protein [Rikenellaceae bacterium]
MQDIVVYILIGAAALFAILWMVRGAKRLNRGDVCDESQCGGCNNSCKRGG